MLLVNGLRNLNDCYHYYGLLSVNEMRLLEYYDDLLTLNVEYEMFIRHVENFLACELILVYDLHVSALPLNDELILCEVTPLYVLLYDYQPLANDDVKAMTFL
jgi:hypothetical protein